MLFCLVKASEARPDHPNDSLVYTRSEDSDRLRFEEEGPHVPGAVRKTFRSRKLPLFAHHLGTSNNLAIALKEYDSTCWSLKTAPAIPVLALRFLFKGSKFLLTEKSFLHTVHSLVLVLELIKEVHWQYPYLRGSFTHVVFLFL